MVRVESEASELEARVREAAAEAPDRVDVELRWPGARQDQRSGPELVVQVERPKPYGLHPVGSRRDERVVLTNLHGGSLGTARVGDVRLADAIGLVGVERRTEPAKAREDDLPVRVRPRDARVVGVAGGERPAANRNRHVEPRPVFDARDGRWGSAGRGDRPDGRNQHDADAGAGPEGERAHLQSTSTRRRISRSWSERRDRFSSEVTICTRTMRCSPRRRISRLRLRTGSLLSIFQSMV